MVLNDRKDERMALNKKGGLGKGLGKGIDSLISNAYAVETKKKDSAAAHFLLAANSRYQS